MTLPLEIPQNATDVREALNGAPNFFAKVDVNGNVISPKWILNPVFKTGTPNIETYIPSANEIVTFPDYGGMIAVGDGIRVSKDLDWIGKSQASDSYPLAISDRSHVLVYGQSNASGADAIPAITTTNVYNHLRFSSGVRGVGGSGVSAIALRETTDGTLGETPCSGIALQWTESSKTGSQTLLLSSVGYGGYSISQLTVGTPPFLDLIDRINYGRSLSSSSGVSHSIPAVAWIQGETDAAANMPKDDYLDELVLIRSSIQEGINDQRPVNTESQYLHMPMIQVSAYVNTGSGPALAQLELSETNPFYHLSSPAYILPHSTNIHYSALGAQMAGRLIGRTLRNLKEDGDAKSLLPLSATSEGREIIWYFSTPVTPLIFDTESIPATPNYGFQIVDSLGVVPLASIEAIDDHVRIVTARDLSGSAQARYALDYNGTNIINGGSGNLRDSTTDTFWQSGVEYNLPRAAPHSMKSIQALRYDPAKIITPATIPLETDAFDHWKFGGSSASLTGLVNGEVLTKTAVIVPVYNTSSVRLPGLYPGTNLQGLISDLDDGIERTYLMVLKRPLEPGSGSYTMIAGTLDPFTGSGVSIDIPGNCKFSNSITSFNLGWDNAMNGGAIGQWVCLIYRETLGRFGLILSGDKNKTFMDYPAPGKVPVSRKIGIGNCYANYSNCNLHDLEFSEFVLWDRALSIPECMDALTRSRMRCAQRGVFF